MWLPAALLWLTDASCLLRVMCVCCVPWTDIAWPEGKSPWSPADAHSWLWPVLIGFPLLFFDSLLCARNFIKLFHFKFHNHLKSLYNFQSYFIYLFFENYLFVYLATLGINCDVTDLPSLSWHWESLVVAHGPGTGQWLNLGPLHWESRVLAPEPPGKSCQSCFKGE